MDRGRTKGATSESDDRRSVSRDQLPSFASSPGHAGSGLMSDLDRWSGRVAGSFTAPSQPASDLPESQVAEIVRSTPPRVLAVLSKSTSDHKHARLAASNAPAGSHAAPCN